MSALPPKADMCDAKTNVRFVPIADSCAASTIDQLISAADQSLGDIQRERLGGLEVGDGCYRCRLM